MEALEEEPAPANGEGAVDSGGAGSTASPAPDGQERLLFVADCSGGAPARELEALKMAHDELKQVSLVSACWRCLLRGVAVVWHVGVRVWRGYGGGEGPACQPLTHATHTRAGAEHAAVWRSGAAHRLAQAERPARP